MIFSHSLPPDVLSWQELYIIFFQAGLCNHPVVAYHYEDPKKKRGVVLAIFRYEIAFIEKNVAQELVKNNLLLSSRDWKLIYDQLLRSTDIIPLPYWKM